MHVPLNVFTEGGGLIDDVDGEITKSEFTLFDYSGKGSITVPAYHCTIDVDGTPFDQYWSCGSIDEWRPSKDGRFIEPVGGATGLRKNSNAAVLFASMAAADAKLGALLNEGDAGKLLGLKAHWLRVPAPKRGGVGEKRQGVDGKEYDVTVLTVSRVIAMPGTGSGGGTKAGGASGSSTDGSGEAGGIAEAALVEYLVDHPEGIARKSLAPTLVKITAGKAKPQEILALAKTDEWVSSLGTVALADGVIKLVEVE